MRVHSHAWRGKILAPCILNAECSFAYCTDAREARKIQREKWRNAREGNTRI